MMRRAILFLSLCLSPGAFGQSNYAVVSGTVADPQQSPVAGAQLLLTSRETHAERRVNTNSQGIFQITGILPGDYDLSVTASGFAELTHPLRLEVGQQLDLHLSLKLASTSTTVQVDSTAADVLHTVDSSIGGNRPNANYFLLDGTTNTDPTFNTMSLSPSPDAVEEFKVETGSYHAEMGGAGGGQINIVTRSGSNAFHGTIYDFLRNDAMDAYTFGAMGSSKFLVQNNFGGSLGGPFVHNKTFFFFNYEGYRHSQADSMTETVPTPEEIAGNFQNSGVAIYDPYHVTI